jgi:predicted exporter
LRVFNPKTNALIWLLLMLGIGLLGNRLLSRPWLETAFLALLPPVEQAPAVEKAIQRQNTQRDRKILWLVGAPTFESARNQAQNIERALHDSRLFGSVMLTLPQQAFADRYRTLHPYRYVLLDETTWGLLRNNPQVLLDQSLAALTSPLGQAAATSLEHDPLLLFNRYWQSLNHQPLTMVQGMAVSRDGEKVWILIASELNDSRLELDKLEHLLALTNRLKSESAKQGGVLLATGMALFTANGADSAKQEISTVGLGSSMGVIVLMLLTFRSPRPLLLSVLAIGSGVVAGFVISILVFGKVHIITLVFGASLIGVADDYALHYVCDSFGERRWQPYRALRSIFPGLLMGLLINLLSYSGLVFSPFPGLQQVALFSAVGLLTAWLTVVLLFPLLLTGFHSGHRPLLWRWAAYWQAHWPHWLLKRGGVIVTVLVFFIVGGLIRLQPRDDIRLLQSADPGLLADAETIQRKLSAGFENQFFLVEGRDVTDWYTKEHDLTVRLNALVTTKKLTRYQAISADWQDSAQQAEHYAALDVGLYTSGLLERHMRQLGFSQPAIAGEIAQFRAAKNRTISLPDWLAAMDESRQSLWLGCDKNACRSIVSLDGIQNITTLSRLSSLAGVTWVDQPGVMSELFARYRVRVSAIIAVAYCLVFAGLTMAFNWRASLTILATPVTASLTALAMLGWCDQLFSLFNLFALLLILGVGVDDAIFFFMTGQKSANGQDMTAHRSNTALAVSLSAFTTLLAFGLLAVSNTEVVHAFGFTVACGITTALLLSPVIGFKPQSPKATIRDD